jgi:hypothetical protein
MRRGEEVLSGAAEPRMLEWGVHVILLAICLWRV